MRTVPFRSRRRKLAAHVGCGTRPVIEAEVVAILGDVLRGPFLLARRGIESDENFVVIDAMEEEHLAVGDDGRCPAGADIELPRDTRPGLRPVPVEFGFGRL